MSLEDKKEIVNFFPTIGPRQILNTSIDQLNDTLKEVIAILLLFALIGCRNSQSDYVMNSLDYQSEYNVDTIDYPLFIEGGTKLVYQYGHMTPDKGLKLYYDTIPYPEKGLRIDESVRSLLSVR